jgi:hypothetical protein
MVYEPLGLSQRVTAAGGESGRDAQGKSKKVKGKSGMGRCAAKGRWSMSRWVYPSA